MTQQIYLIILIACGILGFSAIIWGHFNKWSVEARQDKRFIKMYHKAVRLADEARITTKKKHIVILTEDNVFQIVNRGSIQRLNKARKNQKLPPISWNTVLSMAKYTTI